MNDSIQTRWMSCDDICTYQGQLIELEMTLIKKYHYPELVIPIEYCARSVENLKEYIKEGNTFFWGATENGELIAYYWAYITSFISRRRWVLRSLMVIDDYQRSGLGTIAMHEGLIKAQEQKCDEMATEYVPWNTAAADFYRKNGFEIRRIEVVKRL